MRGAARRGNLAKLPKPLLRERRIYADIKPGLPGHGGTIPGLSFVYVHLNGYRIANPTVLARLPRSALEALLPGYGYQPYFVEGDDPPLMRRKMAATLDLVLDEIAAVQRDARGCGGPRGKWGG